MYLLITPCKNERENLSKLIDSVIKQTVKPSLWIIVDDGSDDGSLNIEKEAAKKYPWIHVLQNENKSKRDLGPHLASVIKKGFEYAVLLSNEQNLDYHYLGNLDADIILPPLFLKH